MQGFCLVENANTTTAPLHLGSRSRKAETRGIASSLFQSSFFLSYTSQAMNSGAAGSNDDLPPTKDTDMNKDLPTLPSSPEPEPGPGSEPDSKKEMTPAALQELDVLLQEALTGDSLVTLSVPIRDHVCLTLH